MENETVVETDVYGNTYKAWRNSKGQMHKLDGPARIDNDGTEYWFKNGAFHRLDGPAIVYPHGRKEWWFNGKLHRIGGPAVEKPNGKKEYYYNGHKMTKTRYYSKEFKVKVMMEE